jgi:pyrroloquinoline quinone (PQQ) biosynthesis protein C
LTLFSRLVAETGDDYRALAAVPQIRDGLAGRISRETYVAYLTEAYHHVRHTVPLMQAARAGLDDAHERFRLALDEYIAEETGHEAWILEDIANCAGDAEAVRRGEPREATRRMVAFAYDQIRNGNPMGFFGMVFVLEGVSIRLASQGASAVASSLGLPPECFTYLSSHGAVDQEHLKFLQRLMDEVEDPDDQSAIIQMAKQIFALFADVFRSIPHDSEAAGVI